MFKKSLIALAAIATLGTATLASAEGHFFAESQRQPAGMEVELGSFNSPATGTVEVYDYAGGMMGELLGSTDVTAGANADVSVKFNREVTDPVLVVLKNGDQTVGMETIFLFKS